MINLKVKKIIGNLKNFVFNIKKVYWAIAIVLVLVVVDVIHGIRLTQRDPDDWGFLINIFIFIICIHFLTSLVSYILYKTGRANLFAKVGIVFPIISIFVMFIGLTNMWGVYVSWIIFVITLSIGHLALILSLVDPKNSLIQKLLITTVVSILLSYFVLIISMLFEMEHKFLIYVFLGLYLIAGIGSILTPIMNLSKKRRKNWIYEVLVTLCLLGIVFSFYSREIPDMKIGIVQQSDGAIEIKKIKDSTEKISLVDSNIEIDLNDGVIYQIDQDKRIESISFKDEEKFRFDGIGYFEYANEDYLILRGGKIYYFYKVSNDIVNQLEGITSSNMLDNSIYGERVARIISCFDELKIKEGVVKTKFRTKCSDFNNSGANPYWDNYSVNLLDSNIVDPKVSDDQIIFDSNKIYESGGYSYSKYYTENEKFNNIFIGGNYYFIGNDRFDNKDMGIIRIGKDFNFNYMQEVGEKNAQMNFTFSAIYNDTAYLRAVVEGPKWKIKEMKEKGLLLEKFWSISDNGEINEVLLDEIQIEGEVADIFKSNELSDREELISKLNLVGNVGSIVDYEFENVLKINEDYFFTIREESDSLKLYYYKSETNNIEVINGLETIGNLNSNIQDLVSYDKYIFFTYGEDTQGFAGGPLSGHLRKEQIYIIEDGLVRKYSDLEACNEAECMAQDYGSFFILNDELYISRKIPNMIELYTLNSNLELSKRANLDEGLITDYLQINDEVYVTIYKKGIKKMIIQN